MYVYECCGCDQASDFNGVHFQMCERYNQLRQNQQESLQEAKKRASNPKDAIGSKKPSLSKVPAIAILHETLAMMDGGGKYGPYNWRGNSVIASIYVDACRRHLDAWFEGQRYAEDSGCHHLGHARACLGILLDAEETGNLIDDRPNSPESQEAYLRVMKEITDKIPAMNERHKELHAKADKKKP